jgi:hypothetical protein
MNSLSKKRLERTVVDMPDLVDSTRKIRTWLTRGLKGETGKVSGGGRGRERERRRRVLGVWLGGVGNVKITRYES